MLFSFEVVRKLNMAIEPTWVSIDDILRVLAIIKAYSTPHNSAKKALERPNALA
jgi:hypothetical protein